METLIRILLIIFIVAFLASHLRAENEEGILDGKGLVCRRADTYFSRPYYFIFQNQKVIGPWVTIDTPKKLKDLFKFKYHITSSVIFWNSHTLTRETLKLVSHANSSQEKVFQCQLMGPQHMRKVVQAKNKKLEKDQKKEH